ncbi:MAG: hypothetical protein LWW85_03310 [Marinilabiliales bacterium]|nr:hypothetical protein [Marinilabiliales bacterium]
MHLRSTRFPLLWVVLFVASCATPDTWKHRNLLPVLSLKVDSPFVLAAGDILVRPNWGWLPGSADFPGGRKYGHVALVTRGGSGATPEEALSQALVTESLFYDQVSGSFQWKRSHQTVERSALGSFGTKFAGHRIRLRMPLTAEQQSDLVAFVRSQLGGGYNIFSGKEYFESREARRQALLHPALHRWHCASLVWEAFYLTTGLDLDANGGWATYPNDLLTSPLFDGGRGRVLF